MRNKLIVISGPSCAGKSPLCDATWSLHPELFEGVEELVLHHSRAKRPDEEDGEDYHSRSREEIEKLSARDDFIVWDVRNDMQALELEQLDRRLANGRVLYEGNVRIAQDLMARHPDACVSAFVSPLSRDEVREWRSAKGSSFADRLTEMMRRRLLRRAHGRKGHLGLADLEDIEARAKDAVDNLRHAHAFDRVIVNHDGEDSDAWSLSERPIGDARLAIEALAAHLRGEDHPRLERWSPELVPD